MEKMEEQNEPTTIVQKMAEISNLFADTLTKFGIEYTAVLNENKRIASLLAQSQDENTRLKELLTAHGITIPQKETLTELPGNAIK